MKGFAFILFLAALGYAGYHYYPELREKFLNQREARTPATQEIRVPEPAPGPQVPPVAKPSPVQADAPTPPPAPSPANKYLTVEEFTQNWTKISASAFPRDIKVLAPVVLKNAVASTTFEKGRPAVAVGFDNGNVIIAPIAGSSLRGSVPIADTSLKSELTATYEAWMARRKAHDLAAASYRQTMVSRPAPVDAGPAGAEPSANPDGSYPVVLASLGSKVTEITPTNITGWDKARLVEQDGQTYWGVIVSYAADTPFGRITTEGQALIQNKDVKKWIYTGSKEEIQ